MNCFKYNIFVFKKFWLIYKDKKPKLEKWKYWKQILKQNAKEPIFKGTE